MSPGPTTDRRRPIALLVAVISAASVVSAALISIIPDLVTETQTHQPTNDPSCVVFMLDQPNTESSRTGRQVE